MGMEGIQPRWTLEQILVQNSTYKNLERLKIRLLRAGLITYRCYICSLKDWLGEAISLHLDHINGVSTDHRLDNLRLLCPNCHSQTPTYGSRNFKLKKLKCSGDLKSPDFA